MLVEQILNMFLEKIRVIMVLRLNYKELKEGLELKEELESN